MTTKRTTHSDLAELVLIIAKKLEAVPAHYLVNDPNTLRILTDAASILIEQDNRIVECVVALRAARVAIPKDDPARDVVNRALAPKP